MIRESRAASAEAWETRVGTGRKFAAALLALAGAALAQAQPHISFAEPVALQATSGRSEFEAYGRRFAVELASNDRLLSKLPATRKAEFSDIRMYRGNLADRPGSWVRLIAHDGVVRGVIWDGAEMYAVTHYAEIADALTTPLNVGAAQTVLYRLADAYGTLPEGFCGLDAVAGESPMDDGEQYKRMVGELRAQTAQAAALGDQIEISLIADGDFDIRTGGGVILNAEVLYRYNIVEGIFAEQVGVLILATDIRTTTGANDPFTSTNPQTLLNQLSSYRSATPAVRARGLAHLITGKTLDGAVAGIAAIDALCSVAQGVSLSMGLTNGGVSGGFASALIMAHEVGHNFGARHDSETTCNPGAYLMASAPLSGEFSSCSLATMAQSIALARGACITPALYSDTSVDPFGNDIQAETEIPLHIPVTVRSTGTQVALNPTVTIVGTGLTIVSVSGALSTCIVAGNTANCTYTDIPINGTRELVIRVRAATVGDHILSVTADAANDAFDWNNEYRAGVETRSSIDAAIAMQVSATPVFIGDTLHVTADITPARSRGLTGSVVTLNITGVTPTAYTTSSGSCTLSAGRVVCELADVPPGGNAHIDVTATATSPGERFFVGSVQTPQDDNFDNNNVNVPIRLQAIRDVTVVSTSNQFDAFSGEANEIQFEVTAPGRETVNDVYVELNIPQHMTAESISLDGVECITAGLLAPRCDIGTMPAGSRHTIVVRFTTRFTHTSTMGARVWSSNDLDGLNNLKNVQIRAKFRVEVSVENAAPGQHWDGVASQNGVTVRAYGYEAAANVVATLEVPPEIRLTGAEFQGNSASTAEWTCALETEQRARCTTPSFGPDESQRLIYYFVGNTPGAYTVQARISADLDTNADTTNNASLQILNIMPYQDTRMSGLSEKLVFQVGQSRDVQVTMVTDRRDVPSVVVRAPQISPYLEIESMSASGATCELDATWGRCTFTNVPANSSIPVTLRYRALQELAQPSGVFEISALVDSDVNYVNNHTHAQFAVVSATDIRLATASSTATAVVGRTLTLPAITITNGNGTALEPVVEVTLPGIVGFGGVSAANAICTGTTIVQCTYSSLAPGASTTINLTLNAATVGTGSVNATVRASNDTNAANNAAAINLTVTAATSAANPPAGGAAGSGGGGRFEWPALFLLGLLLLLRQAAERCR